MAQKRVLVIGAILLAAGIGAPTTAFLAPGGATSEPHTPEVEATVAPLPAESAAPVSAALTLPRTSASPVPPGAGLRTRPSPDRSALPDPQVQTSATRDPRPPLDVPPADAVPDAVPPPPLPVGDRDPADQ